jgi:endo-1,4-beta-xylanase
MMLGLKVSKWGGILLGGAILFAVYLGNVNAGLSTGSKFLGQIIASSVPSNFSTYWNQVTPENATKWGSVESSRDSMYWSQADTAYNYARSNGMDFKFHCLVWGSQQPDWINGLSSTDQKAEVLEWFDAAAAKYGDAEFIDVVNEPLHAQPSYKNAIGGDGSSGWDWVIWAFQEARKRFSGKLLINEYGIISDTNATANYLKIIKLLQAKNLVDGIGIQCHQFNMDSVSTSTMKTVLDTLAATGLPIYVSELDITGDDSTQLARYKEKFPVLWEHASVKGITLWGWIQGQTWKDNTHLITSSGTERPALKWLKEYFSSITPSPTATGTDTPTPTISATPTISITSTATPTASNNGAGIVTYTMYDWGTGATVSIDIKNNGSTAINGWTIVWSFAGNQKITQMWNASFTQSETRVTVKNLSYNSTIPANGSVSFGFNLSYSGSNAKPTGFTVNGESFQINRYPWSI